MTDLQYNFLNNSFTTYQDVENPKVELNIPLMDSPLDISEWASGISSNGTPIVKDNLGGTKMVINNSEEVDSVGEKPEEINLVKSTPTKQYAMEFFKSKGLSSHAAAGIVGNLLQESELNPNASGDNGTSFGIAQWRDPQKGRGRWTNLKNFAKKNGLNEKDLNTQLEFLWHELNTDYKSTLQGLLNSSNYQQATTIFMRRFEKPNEKYANLSQRIKNAASLV